MSNKEIKIIGVNKEKTEKDDSFPAAVSIFFELSEDPNYQWVQCFEKVWEERFYSMKRSAFCEGRYIRMVVASSDNMHWHKEELEKVIVETNKLCKRIVSEAKAKEIRGKEEEKKIVDEAKHRLGEL